MNKWPSFWELQSLQRLDPVKWSPLGKKCYLFVSDSRTCFLWVKIAIWITLMVVQFSTLSWMLDFSIHKTCINFAQCRCKIILTAHNNQQNWCLLGNMFEEIDNSSLKISKAESHIKNARRNASWSWKILMVIKLVQRLAKWSMYNNGLHHGFLDWFQTSSFSDIICLRQLALNPRWLNTWSCSQNVLKCINAVASWVRLRQKLLKAVGFLYQTVIPP